MRIKKQITDIKNAKEDITNAKLNPIMNEDQAEQLVYNIGYWKTLNLPRKFAEAIIDVESKIEEYYKQ